MTAVAERLDTGAKDYLQEMAHKLAEGEAAKQDRQIMTEILALFIHRHGKGRSFKVTAQERAALAEHAPYTLAVRGTADGGIQLRAVVNNG